MPLDHYVSQVHLRNFYSPKLGERMYALRKSDLLTFHCKSEDVCRIESGSTNPYLTEPRIIEEFLTTVEPHYNSALAKLRANDIDRQSIYVIAGFVSYVLTSSPAGMRIFSEPLQKTSEASARVIDAQGLIPLAPAALGGKSLSELLADGTAKIDIDPKYPQALGITTILGRLSIFGNSKWDILRNDFPDSPFFTSDYPLAIEADCDPRIVHRIVPLAPDIAIRIVPDPTLARDKIDFAFPNFRHKFRRLRHAEVVEINRLIVRSAEDFVFYRDDKPWVREFIRKNRHFRIETITRQFPVDRGILNLSSQTIAPYQRQAT
jgi:hypothetical protein